MFIKENIHYMLSDIRKQYRFSVLRKEEVNSDPLLQFKSWLRDALESEELEPTAMMLSSVDKFLQPHSRIVLLKDIKEDGFVFYSNYESNKATQISQNNQVSILFFWQSLERQIRITGVVEKISEEESLRYFHSRPLENQWGAWASTQSQVIENYEKLETKYNEFKFNHPDSVPKPPHWGGYVIKPITFEFWQGRPNRLHDRIFYSKIADNKWKIERLAP